MCLLMKKSLLNLICNHKVCYSQDILCPDLFFNCGVCVCVVWVHDLSFLPIVMLAMDYGPVWVPCCHLHPSVLLLNSILLPNVQPCHIVADIVSVAFLISPCRSTTSATSPPAYPSWVHFLSKTQHHQYHRLIQMYYVSFTLVFLSFFFCFSSHPLHTLHVLSQDGYLMFLI